MYCFVYLISFLFSWPILFLFQYYSHIGLLFSFFLSLFGNNWYSIKPRYAKHYVYLICINSRNWSRIFYIRRDRYRSCDSYAGLHTTDAPNRFTESERKSSTYPTQSVEEGFFFHFHLSEQSLQHPLRWKRSWQPIKER